jgi:hypothetical protein
MRQKRDPESRYKRLIYKQQKELEEYAEHEYEWANDLLTWYKCRNEDIPDDEYRAAAFFINREYLRKPGSLTLCYTMFREVSRELPPCTKENAFQQLCYRFKAYAVILLKGGY